MITTAKNPVTVMRIDRDGVLVNDLAFPIQGGRLIQRSPSFASGAAATEFIKQYGKDDEHYCLIPLHAAII